MDASNKPTAKQGQYLAFIYHYTKLNGRPPAESDMQRYFGTTPPTVHNMVVKLCDRGFATREPGRSRTIRLLVDRDTIPDLEQPIAQHGFYADAFGSPFSPATPGWLWHNFWQVSIVRFVQDGVVKTFRRVAQIYGRV